MDLPMVFVTIVFNERTSVWVVGRDVGIPPYNIAATVFLCHRNAGKEGSAIFCAECEKIRPILRIIVFFQSRMLPLQQILFRHSPSPYPFKRSSSYHTRVR